MCLMLQAERRGVTWLPAALAGQQISSRAGTCRLLRRDRMQSTGAQGDGRMGVESSSSE